MCGNEHIDFEETFGVLSTVYGIKTILVDSGPTLNGALLEKGLVDEISLIVCPVLVSTKSDNLLACLNVGEQNIKLSLLASEVLDNSLVLLRYEVQREISNH